MYTDCYPFEIKTQFIESNRSVIRTQRFSAVANVQPVAGFARYGRFKLFN